MRKINKYIENKIKSETEKVFKAHGGQVILADDLIEDSEFPVVNIKTNLKSKEDFRGHKGIRKIKRLAEAAQRKYKRFIAYILIHDAKGENIAGVDGEGVWFY